MVRVKGMSATCCCGGCRFPLRETDIAPGGVQRLQQKCCSCVPLQVCASILCADGSSDSVLMTYTCVATEGDEDFPLIYSGNLFINQEKVDIGFRFKIIGGLCYFCLESVKLGIGASATGSGTDDTGTGTGTSRDENCILIDADRRSCPDFFCCRMFAEWIDLNISFCGTGANAKGTISLGAADNVDLLAVTQQSAECPNTGTGTGTTTIVLPGSARLTCCGCSCICRCICLSVNDTGPGGVYTNHILCGEISPCGEWSWFNNDRSIVVSLVPPPPGEAGTGECSGTGTTDCMGTGTSCLGHTDGGNCEIELTRLAYDGFVKPSNVVIDDDNKCPSLNAQWLLTNSGESVYVFLSCRECDECSVIETTCCDRPIPRVLTADVTINCEDDCGIFSIALVWDPQNQYWTGTHPTLFCGDSITIILTCVGGTDGFTLTFDSNAPCTGNTVSGAPGTGTSTAGTGQDNCDPLYLTFNFPLAGLGCCDDPFGGPFSASIIVME